MKATFKVLAIAVIPLFLMAWPAMALNFNSSDNITIWDEMGTNPGQGNNGEDNEVEPNCIASQQWDLEAFFFNSNIISFSYIINTR